LNSTGLTLFSEEEWIPADILGKLKTGILVIKYDTNQDRPLPLLKVNMNAFQSTQNYTKTLKLGAFDSSQLNLGFFSGFIQLTELEFDLVDQIQLILPTLSLFPKLTSLSFHEVYGLNDSIVTFPTLSTSGLKSFEFNYGDRALMSRMLDWILLSSAKTLKSLKVRRINITEIPSQIPSFTALERLDLLGNSISTIKSGALSFSVPVIQLMLSNNNISSIEPGAFQGK